MSENYDAAAIIVKLKSQIDGLQKGVAQAKSTLHSFGSGVQETAKNVQAGGSRITAQFDQFDKAGIKTAARFAALTTRLSGLGFAINGLRDIAGQGFGNFQKAAESANSGLQVFAATLAVLPTKLGAITGALAGASLAITKFLAPTREAIEEATNAAKLTESVDEALNTLKRLTDAALTKGSILGDSPRESAQAKLNAARQAAELLLNLQTQLLEKRKEINSKLRAVEGNKTFSVSQMAFVDATEVEAFRNQLGAIDNFLQNAPKRLDEIRSKIPGLNLSALTESAREAIRGIQITLEDTQKITDQALRLGLVGPLDAAEAKARAAERAVQDLIAQAVEFERQTGRPNLELGTRISVATADAKELRAVADSQRELERLSSNFAGAVASGLYDGIMSGAKPMETLAGIGRNLFANAFNDAVASFQKGMTEALNALGPGVGQLLTGLAGVAGFIASRHSKDKAQQSFAHVRSNIESTQAVRGVVAGPASVSVRQVEMEITRGLEPVRQLLQAQLQVQLQIARNTRAGAGSGGGGGGEFPAVAAATA
jgi:hypothetical protein